MKINHLRNVFAWIIVLSSAFFIYGIFYDKSDVYAPNQVVCWDGTHVYLNRGSNEYGGANPGCHEVMKFCKCASSTHEYNYWSGTYYTTAGAPGEAYWYLDPENNTNWLAVRNDTLSASFRFTSVRCADGFWYNTSKTYVSNEDGGVSTTTTTTTTTSSTTTTATKPAGSGICVDCCAVGHTCKFYCDGNLNQLYATVDNCTYDPATKRLVIKYGGGSSWSGDCNVASCPGGGGTTTTSTTTTSSTSTTTTTTTSTTSSTSTTTTTTTTSSTTTTTTTSTTSTTLAPIGLGGLCNTTPQCQYGLTCSYGVCCGNDKCGWSLGTAGGCFVTGTNKSTSKFDLVCRGGIWKVRSLGNGCYNNTLGGCDSSNTSCMGDVCRLNTFMSGCLKNNDCSGGWCTYGICCYDNKQCGLSGVPNQCYADGTNVTGSLDAFCKAGKWKVIPFGDGCSDAYPCESPDTTCTDRKCLLKPGVSGCSDTAKASTSSDKCATGYCSYNVCCASSECGWGAEAGNPPMCISNNGDKSNTLLQGVCRDGKWYAKLGGYGCNTDNVWPCDAGICNYDKISDSMQHYCRLEEGKACNYPNECITENCTYGVCSPAVIAAAPASSTTTTTLCANLHITKYEDANGNGVRDAGESGLQGFYFNVSGPDSFNLKSDFYGTAMATCVSAGVYTITELVQADWNPTQGNPQQATLTLGYDSSVKFGNKRVTTTTTSTTTTTAATTTTTQAHSSTGGQQGTATTTQATTTTIAMTSSTAATSATSTGATSLGTSSTLYGAVDPSIGTSTTEVVSFVTYVSMSTLPGGATETTRRSEIGSGSASTLSSGDTTLPIEVDANGLKSLSEGSEPIADAGGPYNAAIGMPVVFNASKSVAAGNIDRYIWDYGDGQSSEGLITEHVYVIPGTYRATLSIVDDVGKSDLDTKAVYISESSVYVDISAYPEQERYKIGEVLSSIEASVYYSNGSGIDGLSLFGMLSGRVNVSLDYAGIGNGTYRARLDYPIMNGEGAFIDIYVNASDSNRTIVSAVKKLILVPKDSDLRMVIQDPSGRSFAYGQSADFKIILDAGGKSIDSGEISLYEEWTNNKYSFKKEGNNYVLTYTIPQKARSHIPLIVYGTARIDGKIKPAVKDLSFDLSHNLVVSILSPKKGDALSKTKEVRLRVTYPDGTIVSDPELKGTVQESNVSFIKNGEEYAGAYAPKAGDKKLYAWVVDGFGNGGGADVSVTGESSSNGGMPLGQTILYATCAIVLLVCLFFAQRIYSGRRKQRAELLKEYESILQKIKSLKDVRKNLMHEYYTRKILEQDARRGILDFEHELIFEKGRLKQVMQRLGMNYTETEGKEDILEWISQKLSSGENPELLKKGLCEMGLDSGLVDRVRKTIK